LHFEDGSAADGDMTGRQLMTEGVHVHLEHPLSSELVFVEETKGGTE
jgi:NAD-dependent oxidoreductase involved in siderophore biosynthesis